MNFFIKVFKERPLLVSIALIVFVVFCVYASSLANSFIWDDLLVVVHCDFIKSFRNLPLVFTPQYLTDPATLGDLAKGGYGSGEISYRPVVTISYFVDYFLWKLNPFGYHLTNLILHILNTIVFYFFIRLFIKNFSWAFVAALIFALHPVQSEAVNNISFREDLLAFLFYVLSFICFMRLKRKEGNKRPSLLLMSQVFFLLALFSKEMAITLPAMLIFYDYCFERKESFWQRLRNIYFAYFITAAFYLWVWKFLMSSSMEPFIFEGQSAYSNFLTMAKIFGFYIYWLFFPVHIHPTVPDWSLAEFSILSFNVVASITVISLSLYYAYKIKKSSPLISFAIGWFFITLLPVANIFPIQNIIASRYLYLPSAGFSLFAVLCLMKIEESPVAFMRRNFLQKVICFGVAGLLFIYALSSFLKSSVWKNGETFFAELSSYYPNKDWIFWGLAESLSRRGFLDEAITGYKVAVVLNPKDARSYNALGQIYLKKRLLNQAIDAFSRAVQLDPHNTSGYLNLCSGFGERREWQKSIDCFDKFLSRYPDHAEACYNLGVVYWRADKRQEAKEVWGKAISLNSDFKEAIDREQKP